MAFQSPVLRRAGWVTWSVSLACFLFTLLTQAGTMPNTAWFLFDWQAIMDGQMWRLLTPTFLHFTVMDSPIVHLLFNVIIWLNFAGYIEQVEGHKRLLLLFLMTAVVSNGVAYLFYAEHFGGLSGVVFALIGYLRWRGRYLPIYQSIMPDSMFWVFVVFVLVGFTGLLGNMANMAHIGGLIAGLVIAWIVNINSATGV